MSNELSDDKRQQVIALGRLGWSLRSIEQATGVRRETASAYIKAAGISVRPPGWKRAAKPAIEVTTDSDPATHDNSADNQPEVAKPAIQVTTDSGLTSRPSKKHSPGRTLSSCESYREFIQESLQRGRNATAIWQDLVTEHGFRHSYQSVKRFVNKLYPPELQQQARAVIVTEPGEEAQVD
jgi:transposase